MKPFITSNSGGGEYFVKIKVGTLTELHAAHDAVLAAFASPAPAVDGLEVVACDGEGWVFWNPDSGEEYYTDHPIQSGVCDDAERIRKSTPQEDVLYRGMQEWFDKSESTQRLKEENEALRKERDEADNALVDKYRDPKTGNFCFPSDVAAIVRRLDTAEARIKALEEALSHALDHYDRNICLHESVHRGGSIWTICDDCGRQWADDEGGFQPHVDPAEISAARTTLQKEQAE